MKQFAPIFILAALSACGGGGGSGGDSTIPQPPPVEQKSSNGFWNGTASSARAVSAAFLENGEYWAIYSAQGNSSVIAGFAQGNRTTSGGQITSGNLRDFNFEGAGVIAGTLSGSFTERQSMSLTVSYQGGFGTTTLTAAYGAGYETTPSLSTIAGSYSGQVGTIAGVQFAAFSLAANGAISGSSSGCSFTGTAATHASGNIYDILITFGPAPCSLPNTQVSGVAYYEASTSYLYVALVDSGRNNGALFVGHK